MNSVVLRGQAADLGGSVCEKRLNDNQHRSIVVAKGGKLWVFPFLYAKKDRANIDPDELVALRKLAHAYGRISLSELEQSLNEGDLLELSDAFEAIHSAAQGLHRVGAIDTATMREFDENCLGVCLGGKVHYPVMTGPRHAGRSQQARRVFT